MLGSRAGCRCPMTDRAPLPVEKKALYFGCGKQLGHFLHDKNGRTVYNRPEGFPSIWFNDLMDSGLLKNGKRPDVYDGKVFWTGGGRPHFWFAFFWWDRSGDKRSNSNSGFYVRGFEYTEPEAAFAYACETFPQIVERQHHALELQVG